jgi:hypothetical protein
VTLVVAPGVGGKLDLLNTALERKANAKVTIEQRAGAEPRSVQISCGGKVVHTLALEDAKKLDSINRAVASLLDTPKPAAGRASPRPTTDPAL